MVNTIRACPCPNLSCGPAWEWVKRTSHFSPPHPHSWHPLPLLCVLPINLPQLLLWSSSMLVSCTQFNSTWPNPSHPQHHAISICHCLCSSIGPLSTPSSTTPCVLVLCALGFVLQASAESVLLQASRCRLTAGCFWRDRCKHLPHAKI